MVLGMTGNAADSEDIVQDAFINAYRGYENFRGDSSFFTWICRIAINQTNTHMKRRSRMISQVITENLGIDLSTIPDIAIEGDPEAELYIKEVHFKCLHSLTECLPDQQRKALCLCEIMELSVRTAAEILDCSEGAVKTNLHKARKKRKQLMENWCGHLDEENPCRCGKWVQLGRKHGFLSGCDKGMNPDIALSWTVKKTQKDINKLRGIQAVYASIYGSADTAALRERIKKGIQDGEWDVLT